MTDQDASRAPADAAPRARWWIAVLVAVGLIVAFGAGWVLSGDDEDVTASTSSTTSEATTTLLPTTTTTTATATTIPSTSAPTTSAGVPSPEDFFSLSGEPPARFPTTRAAIGFIEVGGDIDEVEAALGPADTVDPEGGYGAVSTWALPGGATLEVGGYPGDQPPHSVFNATLVVADEGPVRFGLEGGVVVGTATLDDLVTAWGTLTECADLDKPDCDVVDAGCIDGLAVLMQADIGAPFSQESAGLDLAARITRVSIGEDQSPGAYEACVAEITG